MTASLIAPLIARRDMPLPNVDTGAQMLDRARRALDAEQDPAVVRAWARAFSEATCEDALLPLSCPVRDYHAMIVLLLLGAQARA